MISSRNQVRFWRFLIPWNWFEVYFLKIPFSPIFSINFSSDLIKFKEHVKKILNSLWIRPIFTIIPLNSSEFPKIGKFGIIFDAIPLKIDNLAVSSRQSLHQLDVSNAFLYGDLIEQVFMEQPPGYVAQGKTSQVCLLRRAIYGLKQSPRAWFVKFSGLLTAYGFNPCKSEPTVMRKTTSAGYVVVEIYVDDILLTGNDEAAISVTKAYLQTHFAIHDLKTPRYFLGIEFAYQSGKLALSQRKCALDLLQETGDNMLFNVLKSCIFHACLD